MSTFLRRSSLVLSSAFLLVCSLCAAVSSGAQGLPQSSAQPRISKAIDELSVVTLHGNTHPLAQAKFDEGPAPVTMRADRLLLVLARSTQQEAELQTWLQSVQDANSPNYRHFLSPEDFGKRFGVGNSDLQTVQAWLTSHGFTVSKVSKSRMAIEFSGTAGQVQSAFHTSLHSYVVYGEQYWANASDPQIPSALAPVVAGLASLNSFKPRAQYIRGPSGVYDAKKHTITPTYTTGNDANGLYIFLGPADAATIYNTPTSFNPNLSGTAYTGAGVTIGIAGDSNIDITQNANYRTTFGLPANPTAVVVDGTDPGENGDAVEAYLDTQVAGGIAPGANVILYTAADTYYDSGLFLAILRALDDNQADILNVSFGGCEADQGDSGNQYILELWEQAAAQGISVTVSSGDSGSAGCDNPNSEQYATQGLAVNGVGSTPYNISVGGTDYDILASNFPTSFTQYVDTSNTLPNHRSALSYIPEEPWNNSTYPNLSASANKSLSALTGTYQSDNIQAAGGGISSIYSVPTWQSSFASGSFRNQPDVSFLAGNGFYGALWGLCTDLDEDSSGNPITDCAAPTTSDNFNLTGVGGTSAAAPAFAGMLALVKQKTGTRLGQANDVLYNLAKTKYATVFHDVTMGDNSVNCQANSSGDCDYDFAGYYFMSGYNANTGYDMASGLGSVNVSQLASNWASVGLAATDSSLQLNGATSALSITHGQSVNVSGSVTSTSGTPTGDIALVDNLSPAIQPNSDGITFFTLTSGSASGTTNYLPGGSYQVSAHYGGSTTFAESDSNAIPVTVAAESSTTTLTVEGYDDPETGSSSFTPYYGFIFLIDAQPYGNSASSDNPNGAATGTITFKNGSKTLGTAALASDGIAELQTATIPGGSDSLTAVFPGDASFQASTSASVALTVTPAPTALQTAASSSNINIGSSVTLKATFIDNSLNQHLDSLGAAPTGTVTFMSNSTTLGTAPVTGTAGNSSALATGSASFTTTQLPQGSNSITATYNGDANYAASSPSSNYDNVYVTGATTNMSIAPASSSFKVNQPLQITVTLPPQGTLPTPTGTVTVTAYSSNVTVYTSSAIQVASGSASVTIPANSLPIGTVTLSAAYSGDTVYYSNSISTTVQVNSSGTIKPTITVTPPTGVQSTYPFSITVTVSGPSGDATPTGSVSLLNPDYTFVPQSLVNGSTTFTVQGGMEGGANKFTENYQGDSLYANGSGTGVANFIATPAINFTPASPAIVANQSLNVTATVSAVIFTPGDTISVPTATGSIIFSSGSYTSSAVQLTAGAASLTIPANSLAVGSDALTATYSGDTNYLPGSSSVTVIVTAIPPPGLTITGTTVTVLPGAATNNASTITVTPTGGFTGSVTLTAAVTASPAGAEYPPTLSFGSTSPVSIPGTANGTATLTITTTAASSTALVHPERPGVPWYAAGGATLACLLLFGIPARRRSWRAMLGMMALLIAFAGGILACGGGGGSNGGGGGGISGTTAGTYTITITGTSGTTTSTGKVTLNVQ